MAQVVECLPGKHKALCCSVLKKKKQNNYCKILKNNDGRKITDQEGYQNNLY
jgi:hypothetical protein